MLPVITSELLQGEILAGSWELIGCVLTSLAAVMSYVLLGVGR